MIQLPLAYQKLVQLSRKARLFSSISSLLHWDQETYMPKKGISVRSEQLELLAGLQHRAQTDPEFINQLEEFIDLNSGLIKDSSLHFTEQRCLLRWRRDLLLHEALPTSFVEAFARLNSEAIHVWSEARKNNNFALFAPYLEKTLEMCRQKARYINPNGDLYDTLIDLHEPEMTASELQSYFTPLKKGLSQLLEKIKKAKQVEGGFLQGSFDKDKQLAFGNLLLKEVGYDLEAGRLDLSAHPFSMSLHPNDSRITTRIHKTGLFDSLSAVLHEAGHSLYEMALPIEAFGTPACEALSLGIHESQSRLYETFIGQSKAFWHSLFPRLQGFFPETLSKVSLDDFYRGMNKVSPSLIRVEADEVTYTFHVILRFELEKQLLEETISVEELPKIWDKKMKEYLGIDVPSVQEGCLQDIHWSMGEFGYFPTYTLGNLYGAQFFARFAEVYPDWEERFASGDFLFIKNWLNEKVHCHGRVYSAKELVMNVTGKPLGVDSYLAYLTKKYDAIYC